MLLRHVPVRAVALLIACCCAAPAQAGLYTVAITGEVEVVAEHIETSIVVGDRVSFSYIFDSDTLDQNPEPWGEYPFESAHLAVGVGVDAASVGGNIVVANDSFLGNDTHGDGYGVVAEFEALIGETWGWDLIAFLVDESGSVFTDVSQPTALDLADFDSAEWGLRRQDTLCFPEIPCWGQVYGTIDSVEIQLVPEPATVLMLASGVGLLAVRKTTRRTSAQRRRARSR